MDAIVSAMWPNGTKYLLADTRSVVIDIPELHYKDILLNFAKSLAGTRAQKLACIVSDIFYGREL
ncbi:hypothetical protein PKOR_15015 [Pontibacter korlensis]|uniref:Uncharacterized protein n=1 Tax=Pontibacter korlensis TaxID=400092 RepID=A0A0E3ZGG8_9BACT|nr:hypothetical protein PKOR_15015 [Pontibacter korlensis]